MSLMGGLELAPLITKIKVDIANFKKDMESVKSRRAGYEITYSSPACCRNCCREAEHGSI